MLALQGTETDTRRRGMESIHSSMIDSQARPADPCVMVIFGASGDLAKRKLFPAIYNLARSHLLRDEFCIIGIGRAPVSRQEFQEIVRESICRQEERQADFDPALCDWVVDRVDYVVGDYREPKSYGDLKHTVIEADKQRGARGNYLFYLATPPDLFLPIVKQIDTCGLAKEDQGWRRFIIEKPFGSDLRTAQELNRELLKIVKESQLYRIDHYLGKETVQNILVLRFSNSIFEPVWNRRYVDHVQITVAETLGVEHRGAFYDKVGALRDMVP